MLDERNFPMDELVLFGSKRSAGTTYTFRGKQIEVKLLQHNDDFKGVDIALLLPVQEHPRNSKNNHQVWCCDDRQLQRIPYGCRCTFVVPEVNAEDALERPRGVIANPNCTTIQMVVALKAIEKLSHIKPCTCLPIKASGAGAAAMDELYEQYRRIGKRACDCREVCLSVGFQPDSAD